jgi:zinc/manganese transport system permease protein
MSDFLQIIGWVWQPFTEPGPMRQALVACLALSLGSGPVGVVLVLRRMSLIGDTMSHAMLPGIAIGFMLAGMSLTAMTLGGFVVGLLLALGAGIVTRFTPLKEDASLAAFFVISLAIGVLLISSKGDPHELIDVLFGDAVQIGSASLLIVAGVATVTLIVFALIYRPLISECFDPIFLRAAGGPGTASHFLFLAIVVLNMVADFQAMGTLMAVAIIMLPAIAARFWAREVWSMIAVAMGVGAISGAAGLTIAYHAAVPSGPCITLVAGSFYLFSLGFGRRDSFGARYLRRRHLAA